MNEELSYAYAVVRPTPDLAEGPVPGVTGVASGAVRVVGAGALAAAVGSVPRSDFSEAALKVRLEDLDWLERVARAHHGVVEALAARTTVLPLRLATVYVDDDRVRDVLRRGEETFTRMLDRLTGHVEWGVKVYAEVPRAPAAPAADDAGASDPGRAYLRRRRQQREERGTAWSEAAEAVRRIEAEAGEIAVRLARHRPQQGRLAVGTGENVANDAYLVPGERSEEFRDRVRRSTRDLRGVRVEITGPWAPYSFAVLTEEPEAPGEVGGP
ncbi:GvpL/GvpF family gas vesicle protein [Streptomyces roseicoloratus]|uniref:GvpL/GvpF family gas vesicle protein n=1 Tax=Streptomyces roseicoloratus TaxID=2508722 RepID=A0ABY9RNF7_9ACTN|nr:GvpL/GvpF family gas vesicle protein [Streptomyces roseicoloratus]WMX43734.1 GvpL/GvpF family gas vesicle protein [Streptomyces roseicoloratus]